MVESVTRTHEEYRRVAGRSSYRAPATFAYAIVIVVGTFAFFCAFERLSCVLDDDLAQYFYRQDCASGKLELDVTGVADTIRANFADWMRRATQPADVDRLDAMARALEVVAPVVAPHTRHAQATDPAHALRIRMGYRASAAVDPVGPFVYPSLQPLRRVFLPVFQMLSGTFSSRRQPVSPVRVTDMCDVVGVPPAWIEDDSGRLHLFGTGRRRRLPQPGAPQDVEGHVRLWRGFTVCSAEPRIAVMTALDPWLHHIPHHTPVDTPDDVSRLLPAVVLAVLMGGPKAPVVVTGPSTPPSVVALAVSTSALACAVRRHMNESFGRLSATVVAVEPDPRLHAAHLRTMEQHSYRDLDATVAALGNNWVPFARAYGRAKPHPLVIAGGVLTSGVIFNVNTTKVKVWPAADGTAPARYEWPGDPHQKTVAPPPPPAMLPISIEMMTVQQSLGFAYKGKKNERAAPNRPVSEPSRPTIVVVDVGAWRSSYGISLTDGAALTQAVTLEAAAEFMLQPTGGAPRHLVAIVRSIVVRDARSISDLAASNETTWVAARTVDSICRLVMASASCTVSHLLSPRRDACAAAFSVDSCRRWNSFDRGAPMWSLSPLGAVVLGSEGIGMNAPCAILVSTAHSPAMSLSGRTAREMLLRDAAATAGALQIRNGPLSIKGTIASDGLTSSPDAATLSAEVAPSDVSVVMKWCAYSIAVAVGCVLVRGVARNLRTHRGPRPLHYVA